MPNMSLNQSIHSADRGLKYISCKISIAPPIKIGKTKVIRNFIDLLDFLIFDFEKSRINTMPKKKYKNICTTLSILKKVGASLNVEGLANERYNKTQINSIDFQYCLKNP